MRRLEKLILAFGVVNAALYSSLLPLWEGFDEPFHYSYVESLWQTRALPILGRSLIAAHVNDSFRLAPFSHVVHRWIPQSITFGEWFALTSSEKAQRRAELEQLRPHGDAGVPNYEAHHPPLAYAILAVADLAMSRRPLLTRVLVLRLISGIGSVMLVFYGARSLCRTLEVPELYASVSIFTVFCSQMFYATTAHVSNDWLAVGISAMFLAELARFVRDAESPWRPAAWLALGLLTKAYFLAFLVLAAIVAIWMIRRLRVRSLIPAALLVLVVAGPWYARNLKLYGNISGTHEEFDGIGIRQALAAAPRIDWIATTGFLARGSLWTGNNSFTTFSRTTLNLVLALLAVEILAWLSSRSVKSSERAIFAGIVLFSGAVAYASCAAFAHTKGDAAGASPWYTQVLLVPVLALAYLGMSRWNRVGAALASITLAIWTWILIATWTLKLFPMYSGAGENPMRLRDGWNWYAHRAVAHAGDLSLLAMVSAAALYAGMLVSIGLSASLAVLLMRRMRLRAGSNPAIPDGA